MYPKILFFLFALAIDTDRIIVDGENVGGKEMLGHAICGALTGAAVGAAGGAVGGKLSSVLSSTQADEFIAMSASRRFGLNVGRQALMAITETSVQNTRWISQIHPSIYKMNI